MNLERGVNEPEEATMSSSWRIMERWSRASLALIGEQARPSRILVVL
jgi:hypothetical protein